MKHARVRNKKEKYVWSKETGDPLSYMIPQENGQVPYSMMKNAYHKQSSKFFTKFHNCTTCVAASMKNIKTPRTLNRQKEDDS